MLSISQTTPALDSLMGFNQQDREVSFSQYTKVSTLEHERLDITLLTEEGDRVTISSESRISSEYASYRGLLMKDNLYGDIQKKKISLNSYREFSITVDGNLSEEELSNIQKAIKMVDKIMQELKSGDIEKAIKLADNTIDLESISGLSASMELEKSVKLEEHVQTSVTNVSPEPANDRKDNYDRLMDRIKSLSDKIMDIINNADVDESKIIKPLASYLSQFTNNNPVKNSDNHNRDDLLRMTGAMLLDRIKQMKNESPAIIVSGQENGLIQQ